MGREFQSPDPSTAQVWQLYAVSDCSVQRCCLVKRVNWNCCTGTRCDGASCWGSCHLSCSSLQMPARLSQRGEWKVKPGWPKFFLPSVLGSFRSSCLWALQHCSHARGLPQPAVFENCLLIPDYPHSPQTPFTVRRDMGDCGLVLAAVCTGAASLVVQVVWERYSHFPSFCTAPSSALLRIRTLSWSVACMADSWKESGGVCAGDDGGGDGV